MKLFENAVPIGKHEIAVLDYANNDIKTSYEVGQARPFLYPYTYEGYLDAFDYCRDVLEMSDEEINALSKEQRTETATVEEVTESVAENGEANEFGGYDIGENQSGDSTYEYYNFYYEGKKFALTKCLDGYKASDCVGKIYVKPIHPYDEAERPWAVSSDGGYHWRIMCNKKMIDGMNTDDLQHVLRVVKSYDDDIEPIRAIN